MHNRKRISVIMGIYNCADTLSEAIESLLSQTTTDWELIMCDDASSDNGKTLSVAKKYANEYDNICVISNKTNEGLAASLNHCLEYASGEYIARMDGDDISMPTRFEEEEKFLDSHPEYAFVSCAMIYFDDNGDWGWGHPKSEPEKMDFVWGRLFCHAPVMMRKNALNDVGNYTVRESLRRGQDVYLWHKFYLAGYKGYNLDRYLYKMRDDQHAIKRRTFKSRILGVRDHIEIMRNLGIPRKYYIVPFKSIIIGLMPNSVYKYFHQKKLSNK